MSFHAVILASVMADIFYRSWLGQAPDIHMTHYPILPLHSLWLFVVLGILFGFIGYFFNLFLVKALDLFDRIRGWRHLAAGTLVGALVGLAGLQAPHYIGGGYDTINWALTTQITEITLITVFLIRFAATIICYGTGSPGVFLRRCWPSPRYSACGLAITPTPFFRKVIADPGIFAVAGMAALFAASVRAPMTGIVLAVEMTLNYTLVLPLLITCLVATMVAHRLGGQPIYSVLLRRTLERAKKEQAARAGLTETAGKP